MSRVTVSMLQVILLAAWFGAAAFFSASVAQAAFAVLPTRALAGALVGKVLPVLAIAGATIALAVGLSRRFSLPLSVGVQLARTAMLLSLLGMVLVFIRIDKLRAQMGGPIDSLAPGDPLRMQFGRLHGISVGLLGVAMIAALVALILITRALGAALSHRIPDHA